MRGDPFYDADARGPVSQLPVNRVFVKLAVFGAKKGKALLFEYYDGDVDFRESKVEWSNCIFELFAWTAFYSCDP